jgi:hypothetical protein
MLSSIQTALAKKFAPADAISGEFNKITSESAELDRKIEEKKAKLQEAGWADPQSVQRLAGELNALEAQRKSNETAVAALQSGLEASKAAEKAAERAKQRAELLRRVETDKAFMNGMYQQLAKQMLPGLKHLEETERLVFQFNLQREDDEPHVTSAETALRKQPSQNVLLSPLHWSVALPQVNPADEPFRKALTPHELQGEALAREAALRIATRKRTAIA